MLARSAVRNIMVLHQAQNTAVRIPVVKSQYADEANTRYASGAAVAGWPNSARWVPQCMTPTAYLTLLTIHKAGKDSRRAGSFLAQQGLTGLVRQIDSILVLAYSLRAVEICRRDFVLLLGEAFELPPVQMARLRQIDGLVVQRVPPVRFGRATLDKVHAWNLTQYSRILVIDSDAIALQPLDAVFDGGEGTMGAHTHEPGQQAACGISMERRANGGFYVIEPRLGGYEDVTRHIDANPQFWSMELTNHTPQQTGTSCYFESRRRLRTLPCAYWYDIATNKHRTGTYWHGLCLSQERRGRAQRGSCKKAARLLEAHCLWGNASRRVHAVHFKGGQKPWRFVGHSCEAATRAGLLHGDPISSSSSGRVASLPEQLTSGPSEPSVTMFDDLIWNEAGGACVSRSRRARVFFEATAKPIPKTCCRHEVLLSSQWHSVLRSIPLPGNRSASSTAPRW